MLLMIRRRLRYALFPYTTLFRSGALGAHLPGVVVGGEQGGQHAGDGHRILRRSRWVRTSAYGILRSGLRAPGSGLGARAVHSRRGAADPRMLIGTEIGRAHV